MKHIFLLSLLATIFLLINSRANAQAPKIKWEKSYGGSRLDIAYSVQQTSDSGYVAAGITNSNDDEVTDLYDTALNVYNAWILKVDNSGNITWSKAIGGSSGDDAYAIEQTTDGGYIVTGTASSTDGDLAGVLNIGHHADMWIIKLDASGNISWQKCLGGSYFETGTSIQQTTDGGYIVAGQANSPDGDVTGIHKDSAGDPTPDIWVVKLDDTGGVSWQKCLGGAGFEIAQSVKQTSDGGYIVAGYTNSHNGDITKHYSPDSADYDGWVIKLSNAGALMWQKSYGGTQPEEFNSILQTSDGGYIFTGLTQSNDSDVSGNHVDSLGNPTQDLWVVKTDSLGTIGWQRCYGGTGIDYGSEIQPTADSGYVVAGYTNSGDGDVTGDHRGPFSYSDDCWVLQLTNTGSINWNKCMGGIGEEEAYSIKVTNDGGYIIAGDESYNSGDVTGNHGSSDYWLIKLASPLGVNNVVASSDNLQIFPNPARTAFTIKYHFGINENASAEITDVTGRVISFVSLNKNNTQAEINAASWVPGTYFYKVIQNNITVAAGKLVKD